jgi:pimeloyl-ACP methyl ester carboxylesterase
MKEYIIEFDVGKMTYYLSDKTIVDQTIVDKTIVFLHGWGQNYYSFENVVSKLETKYQIIGLDFLGFGNSDEPNRPLTVDDYTSHLEKLLEELDVKNPILIGHSFGARVAILYASKNEVDKLFLVNAAGIRSKSLKLRFKIIKYKLAKRIYKIFRKNKLKELIKNSGSTDYQQASNVMKRTLSLVVSRDLKREMKSINTKTYLLWGILDDVTPYKDVRKIENIIENSENIPFYNSGHFTYLEEETKFVNTLKRLI